MRFPQLILVSLFVLFFTGCSKDDPATPTPETEVKPEPKPEEPENVVYFTFNGRKHQEIPNYKFEDWVVVHDSNGNFLEYKLVEPDSDLIFESASPLTENITVTIIRTHKPEGSIKSSYVDTYMGIQKGTVWSQSDFIDLSESESFTFNAINVPEWSSFALTSGDSPDAIEFSRSYDYRYPDLEEGNLRLDNVSIHTEKDFIFSLMDEQGKSKYQLLPNMKDGDNITILQ